jgi:hypothetical protein
VPRYYFHVRRGQVTMLDHEGTDLATVADAGREASRRRQEIRTQDGSTNWGSVIVSDENRRTVWEVPL